MMPQEERVERIQGRQEETCRGPMVSFLSCSRPSDQAQRQAAKEVALFH